jgi:hypothetical protein
MNNVLNNSKKISDFMVLLTFVRNAAEGNRVTAQGRIVHVCRGGTPAELSSIREKRYLLSDETFRTKDCVPRLQQNA